jgi:RNase P subunit RPR2
MVQGKKMKKERVRKLATLSSETDLGLNETARRYAKLIRRLLEELT